MIEKTLLSASVIIIPGWVYRRLIINKLNIVDMNNYSNLRKILSLNDLAEWRFLNDEYKVDDCFLSSNLLYLKDYNGNIKFLNTIINEDQKKELYINLDYLTKSEEIKNSIFSKLDNLNPYITSYYKFINSSNNTIYLIIEEGFNSYIVNNKLNFMREYINNCYNMMPEQEVSSLSAYNLYLQQLALE